MTDTLITVDVRSAALVQRAKAGQAAGRQAAIDREQVVRQEKEVQRERQRRERAGIDRLNGRRRDEKRRRREEPAAGVVQAPTMIALAFVQSEKPQIPGETGLNNYFLYSGDRNTRARIVIPDDTASGSLSAGPPTEPGIPAAGSYTLERSRDMFIVLPAGKDRAIVTSAYIIGKTVRTWQWTFVPGAPPPFGWQYSESVARSTAGSGSASYVATKRSTRQISSTPAVLAGFMTEILENEFYNGWPYAEELAFFSPLLQGLSIGLWEYDDAIEQKYVIRGSFGTPATTAGILNVQPPIWSPTWIDFRPSGRLSETGSSLLQGYRTKELDPMRHYPLSTEPGSAVNGLEFPILFYAEDVPDMPLQQRALIAWDWGKPELCRRLLLQLGFTAADLRP